MSMFLVIAHYVSWTIGYTSFWWIRIITLFLFKARTSCIHIMKNNVRNKEDRPDHSDQFDQPDYSNDLSRT